MKYRKLLRVVLPALALAAALHVSAWAGTLIEKTDSQLVTKGVTYHQVKRLTTDGYLEINYLAVDLTRPYLQIKELESATAYGLKETTQQLVWDHNAVAGVNGDFFGMAGTYSDPFGLVVEDGSLHSAGTDRNVDADQYASLFLTEDGDAFFDYFRLQVQFLNNGESHLELASMNKISEMKYPIYFDQEAGATTAAVDARFGNIVKLVCENGYITYISWKGETVTVPENGYLILIPGDTYDALSGVFAVGQTAALSMQTTVDLSNVETAFSGGEWVLQNGVAADVSGKTVTATGRQPRTAMGLSQDKKTLYLATVDGRGNSMGATHAELAAIMQGLGAYNAVNLDGGGSTTLVAQTVNDSGVTVKNSPSDGTQRKVINAVGILDTAPVGEASQLVVKPADDRVFMGQSLAVNVYGYDEYYHKVSVPAGSLQLTATSGSFADGTFVADTPGVVTLKAVSGDMAATATVTVMQPAALVAANSAISLQVGASATLGVTAIDKEGFTAAPVTGITYTLSDPSLGTISGDTITAVKEGTGTITASFGGVSCTIAVGVGGKEEALSLSGATVGFSGYPANVSGTASNENGLLTLAYTFGESTATQAGYLLLGSGISLPANTSALTLSVNGNGCGDWLRGRVRDANGNTYPIDFTKSMTFSGWTDLTATMPTGTGPFTLESIYLAALTNGDTTAQTLQFQNLRATVANMPEGVNTSSGWTDPLSVDITGTQSGGNYITMAGNLALDLTTVARPTQYTDARVKAFQALQEDSNLYLYLGTTDVTTQGAADKLTLNGGYRTYTGYGVTLIRLNTSAGGITDSDASQWALLQNDALTSSSQHILFLVDVTPGNFSNANETTLLREFFQTLRQAGKDVFVISTSGTGLWSSAKDGVRYLNLPDLWTADGQLNQDAAVLRFRVDGAEISYEVQKLF